MSDQPVKLNQNEVIKYLRFLDPNPSAIFTYFFMTADSKAPIKGYGCIHGTSDDMLEQYHELSKKHVMPNAHVCINETDLKGRRKENIEAVRVLCLDIDEEWTEHKYNNFIARNEPHLVVESSSNKHHFYWKIENSTTINSWILYQAGLSKLFNGDANFCDITKTIRVPGFARIPKSHDKTVTNLYPPHKSHDKTVTNLYPPHKSHDKTVTNLYLPHIKYELLGMIKLSNADIYKKWPELTELGNKALSESKLKRSTLLKSARKNTVKSKEKVKKLINSASKGKRNETLFSLLFDYIKEHKDCNEDDLIAYAQEINESFEQPLGRDETKKTIDSAMRRGTEYWKAQADKKQANIDLLTAAKSTINEYSQYPYDYSSEALSINRFSDPALVDRVVQRYQKQIVLIGEIVYAFDETTLTWTSQKLTPRAITAYVNRCLIDTIHDPKFIDAKCLDSKGNYSDAARKKAEEKYLSAITTNAVVGQVIKYNKFKKLRPTDFDCEQHLLMCGNGLLNMLTGEIRAPKAEDYLLRRTPIDAVDSAACPYWENFIRELFCYNEEPEKMVLFMQELFGYSLTTSIKEQRLFIHEGSGCNGKSKVLETLALIAGEYCAKLGSSVLSKSKNNIQKEFERLGVKAEGRRVIVIDDLDTKTQWNEGYVKMFTASEIPTRKLYEEEKDIPNRAKFHIGCNEMPLPEGENFGLLRRLCIIPYARQFEANSVKEGEILQKIKEEAPGILWWAVKGLRRTIERGGGLVYPAEVIKQIEAYRHEHFSVETLIREMFQVIDDGDIGAEEEICTAGDGNWHSIDSLITDVNNALESQGKRDKFVSVDSLGKRLNQVFGNKVQQRRIIDKKTGRKVRQYRIKLCYDAKSFISLL